MNKIFVGMMLIGVIVSCFTGQIDQVSVALLDCAKEAVQLSITMLGVVGMWTGVLKVAEEVGICKALAKFLESLIHFLYPSLKGEHAKHARMYIAENMAANFLGLGWAATPTGLRAMKELKALQKQEGKGEQTAPTDAMCMFLLINVSSLQLIPMNIIAYRSQYGAVCPTAIIVPSLIATTISTLVAVVYGKWKMREK